MSPRRSAEAARATREAIVERAVDVASVEGLEGLTIGRLAAELQMSKSGVLGHFGTKEALQQAALEEAIEIFTREVWQSAREQRPGLTRLAAICEAWVSYLQRRVFPGGCFLTAAACEFDGRGGPVHDTIAAALGRWSATLRSEVRAAVDAGEMPRDTDPRMVAFEINALALGANQAIQLFGDRRAGPLALRAMRATLGLEAP